MNPNTRGWKILQLNRKNALENEQQQADDAVLPLERSVEVNPGSCNSMPLEHFEPCSGSSLVYTEQQEGEIPVLSDLIIFDTVDNLEGEYLIVSNVNDEHTFEAVPNEFINADHVGVGKNDFGASASENDSTMLDTNDDPADNFFPNHGEGSNSPKTQNLNNEVVVHEMILDVPPASEDSDRDHEYHQPPTSEDTDSSFEEDFQNDYNGNSVVICSDQDLSVLQELPPDQRVAQSVCVMKKGRGRKQEETKTRKRKLRPENWERNKRKAARAAGQPYRSSRGKFVPGKALKPPCKCRMKCYEKFDEDARTRLFVEFHKLSPSAQNQFICNNITEVKKGSERIRPVNQEGIRRAADTPSRRNFSRKYKLSGLEICQTMFMNTLCVSLMKMRVLVNKCRVTGTSVCPEDKRGKHGHHPKLSEEEKGTIKTHIDKFPAYESHYSRQRTEKKYLKSDLSISKMHRLYVNEMEKSGLSYASEAAYRKMFVEEFNLGFKAPKLDTCHKCDKFKLLTETADPEKKRQIEDEYKKHLDSAQQLYDEKKRDKTVSYEEQRIAFACFDLQQCLPTRRSGLSFYKRSLWTFNLTVFSIVGKTKRSTCFMWDETVAQRGGQEIQSLPDEVEEVNLYSDCCSGQTRNIYFTVMCLLFMSGLARSSKNLKTINHKFLVPGHTHMEADCIHALIEKTKKNQTEVSLDLPKDWMNLIRSIHCRTPIVVEEMNQADFKKFSLQLASTFVHRKTNTAGEPVEWLNIRWLQYRRDGGTSAFYKKSLQDTDFLELDLSRKKKSRRCSAIPVDVGPLYDGPLPLPAKKVSDHLSVLEYIHSSSRDFYKRMRPDVSLEELPPWNGSSEDENEDN